MLITQRNGGHYKMTLKNLIYYPLDKRETPGQTDIDIAIGLLNNKYYKCYRVALKTSTVRYLVAQKQEGLIDTYVKLLLLYANSDFLPFMCGDGMSLDHIEKLEKMKLVRRTKKEPRTFIQVFTVPQENEPLLEFPFVCRARDMFAQDIYKAIFKLHKYMQNY